jgi:Tfp pilus assembly protein PilF
MVRSTLSPPEVPMRLQFGLVTLALCLLIVGGLSWADMNQSAPPLKSSPGSKAEAHNDQGIEHYHQGHWDVARKHFLEAAKADPRSAEAHYNVALALDKAGDHKGATEHFRMAYDLGRANPEIQQSKILAAHFKMK